MIPNTTMSVCRNSRARPVILAATGGSDRHALVIEHHFSAEGDLTEAMIGRIPPAVDQLDA